MSDSYRYGPFDNDESKENVAAYPNPAPRPRVDHDAFRAEITEYFTRRRARLRIVKTTPTARGQLIDWIPIESQHPNGIVASAAPRHVPTAAGQSEAT